MPQCTNCGTHVTGMFARVFGDNEDTIHRCMNCAPNTDLDKCHRPVADENGVETHLDPPEFDSQGTS